jgi:hypothetical protein
MGIPQQAARMEGAITGWQGPIQGTLAAVSGTPTYKDLEGNATVNAGARQPLAGATLATGTYYFFIPTSGCSAVDVTLRETAGNANIDTTNTKLFRVLVDGVSEKMNAAGISAAVAFGAFTNALQQTASVTGLRGERGVLLKLVLTGSVTFDQAEFSAL